MILGFSTQLNGKSTYFVERIHQSLKSSYFKDSIGFSPIHVPKDFDFVMYPLLEPKHHTIREDKTDRWKEGTKIDFFINCRQPTMFRFAPVLPVVSTQNIHITYTIAKKAMVFIDDVCFYMQDLSAEGNHKMLHLAQNDGFDTIEDFFKYFSENFKGKVIHWTDLRY
jgi:hypothetical protein